MSILFGRRHLLLSIFCLLSSGASPHRHPRSLAFVTPATHRPVTDHPDDATRSSTTTIAPASASASSGAPPVPSRPPENPADPVTYFRGLVEDDPDDAGAHLNLGVALRQSGEPTQARDVLRRVASELRPDSVEAWYQLGLAATDMGIVDEAVGALERAASLAARPRSDDDEAEGGEKGGGGGGPPNPAEVALANVLLDGRGDKENARRVFGEACTASGGGRRPGPVSLLAGLAAGSCGEWTEARRHLEDAVRFDPRDVDAALHLMARCHLEPQGNDDDGAAAAELLRRRLPEDVVSSWDYILEAAPELAAEDPESLCYFTHDVMHLAMNATDVHDGLLLEFGVFHGKTIRMIASYFPDRDVHGFDTFSGLPEDWRGTSRGAYSTLGALPSVPDNVQFHVGLFSDTLPGFLRQHPDRPIRLMNIDCDLYSSTKDVFDAVHERVVPGTVIVFDEYIMNPHWRQDEYKAFQEAVREHGWSYRYIAISLASGQAAVQIL